MLQPIDKTHINLYLCYIKNNYHLLGCLQFSSPQSYRREAHQLNDLLTDISTLIGIEGFVVTGQDHCIVWYVLDVLVASSWLQCELFLTQRFILS